MEDIYCDELSNAVDWVQYRYLSTQRQIQLQNAEECGQMETTNSRREGKVGVGPDLLISLPLTVVRSEPVGELSNSD